MPPSEGDHEGHPPEASEASPLLGERTGQSLHDGSTDQQKDSPQKDGLVQEHEEGRRPYDDQAEDTGEDDVPLAEEPSNARLVLIMSSVWVGVLFAALDSTIIATLVAPISTEFNSLSLLSWLASAYLVANAACQPLSGRLTDIFSRRTGLLFSNIFFAAGNLICGLATSEWVIILGRVVAGMGGGGIMAISTFVGSDLVPLRKRGVVQGVGNICYGVGSGLGGLFGGWINDVWSWRAAFLIQVPLMLVSTIFVFFVVDIPVKETSKSPLKRIDFLGATTLVLSLVLLLLGLNSGGNIVPWNHPLVYVSLPLSALSFALFVYVEEKIASEPIIPTRLLLHRTVASACLTNWLCTMTLYSILFYAPIYFQVKGLSTTQAGLRLIPQSLGTAFGSMGAGIVMNTTGTYFYLNVGNQTLFMIALGLICSLSLTTPTWSPFLYLFLMGSSFGAMLTTTLLALISAVDHAHQAVATSASYAFRSTGSTIGITVASAVFQNILKAKLWARFGTRDDAVEVIGRIRDSFDEIRHLPPGWTEGVMQSYMDALRGVFLVAFGLAVLGSVISLGMREHKLHTNLARR
ncbi:MAG: hypothetical protein M1833_003034 [Piccolia ochrophora]|nr:MAG: hypothetical protein M1833_003034 [Piccolia ochrophora]